MALQEYVARGVTEEALDALVRDGSRRWFYGEWAGAIALDWLATALQSGTPWTAWDHGRAFDEAGELAWWREAGGFTVRVLTAGAAPEGLSWQARATWRANGDASQATLLHGEPDKEQGQARTWYEARIPRPLHYPLPEGDPPDRVVLLAQPLHNGDEIVGITRLVGVKGIRGGSDG